MKRGKQKGPQKGEKVEANQTARNQNKYQALGEDEGLSYEAGGFFTDMGENESERDQNERMTEKGHTNPETQAE